MLKIIYEERNLTLRNMTFSKARDMIEIRKISKEPEYYLDMITMSLDTLRQKYEEAVNPSDIIFYGYLYQEKKCFGLDYNDLIKFSLYIFQEEEEIRLKWQRRLEYIMIDEFQDIDDLQYRLMEVLCNHPFCSQFSNRKESKPYQEGTFTYSAWRFARSLSSRRSFQGRGRFYCR